MADYRLEPRGVTPVPPPAPPVLEDEEFHCPNCKYLGEPGQGFWCCQNLCVRD